MRHFFNACDTFNATMFQRPKLRCQGTRCGLQQSGHINMISAKTNTDFAQSHATILIKALHIFCNFAALQHAKCFGHLEGNAAAHALTEWHHEVGESVLLGLVLLHVGAVVFYRRVLRKDLITPMVSGDKVLPAGTTASADSFWTRLLGLAVAMGSMALVAGVLRLVA